MNPLTNMKNVQKLSEQELYTNNKTSWHHQYRDSAWIFAAGFPYELTEGDLICIFSQYGEIIHINLVRDKETGKSRGFCFVCYEDQRSTVLAVDNFNGIKILNRILRVDHVSNYKVPKSVREEAAKAMPPPIETPVIKQEPVPVNDYRETLADQIEDDIKLPQRLPIYTNIPVKIETESVIGEKVREKKEKKSKKSKKKKSKKKRKTESSDSSDNSDSSDSDDGKRKKKKNKR